MHSHDNQEMKEYGGQSKSFSYKYQHAKLLPSMKKSRSLHLLVLLLLIVSGAFVSFLLVRERAGGSTEAPKVERRLLEPVSKGGQIYAWREPNDLSVCKMHLVYAKPNQMVDGPVLKGVSFKIPSHVDWAGPDYRLSHYLKISETNKTQDFEFGPVRFQDRVANCEWNRDYWLRVQYSTAFKSYVDDLMEGSMTSIRELLVARNMGGGSIEGSLVVENKTVSPPNHYEYVLLKYIYRNNDGSTGQDRSCHLKVIGRSVMLDFSGRCQEVGSEEAVFDQLKSIVDSIWFDRNF